LRRIAKVRPRSTIAPVQAIIQAMKKSAPQSADYYNQQYNARAMIPEHPSIFTRWQQDSARVRRTTPGLFDLAYGDVAEERLDFFPTSRPGAPLLVFIHGGWWRTLDKSDFSFIAPAYTRAGINVAFTNYTLAPRASIEEIVMQQVRALAWLYRNAEHYEANRDRIAVAGHSAGAHLTAMLLAAVWPAYADDLPRDLVKAGVMLSGLYDLEPVQYADFVNIDLELTAQRIGPLSPASMQQSHNAPFITAVGGRESDEFKKQNALIGARWKANHLRDIALPDENHLTICDAFANTGHPLFAATCDLVMQHK
jgi:arylformamidase